MRKTKIICTIGPASESEDMIRELCKAGMNVARLNFSHGSHEEHKARVEKIKKIRTELDLPIAIMLDTKGPEYRIGVFENGKAELHEGDKFTFTTNEIIGDNTKVSVSYKNLAKELNIGDTVLVNNGLTELRVVNTTAEEIECEVIIGGIISDRKSMAFPGKHIHQKYLSDKDKEDLLFAIENDLDFIACSFVSVKEDLEAVHEYLEANGGSDISLIAKIEIQSGYVNIEEIWEWRFLLKGCLLSKKTS